MLAAVQAYGIAVGLEGMRSGAQSAVIDPGLFFRLVTVMTLVGGTVFLMWLGEQITARGVGNGISLIIMAGIVANLPHALAATLELGRTGALSPVFILLFLAMSVAVVAFIVFMERAQRRILVQYPKRQVGNRMFGGEASHLPLKINTSGVIPPIFASSLLLLPATIATFEQNGGQSFGWLGTITAYLGHGRPAYMIALCRPDRVLLLLLHGDRLQPDRDRRQSAQIRRLHPGHPAGQEHRRLSRLCADPADRDRRGLSRRRCASCRKS